MGLPLRTVCSTTSVSAWLIFWEVFACIITTFRSTPPHLGNLLGFALAGFLGEYGDHAQTASNLVILNVRITEKGVEFKGGSLHDGFGGFDGFGGSGGRLTLLLLVLQNTGNRGGFGGFGGHGGFSHDGYSP